MAEGEREGGGTEEMRGEGSQRSHRSEERQGKRGFLQTSGGGSAEADNCTEQPGESPSQASTRKASNFSGNFTKQGETMMRY